MSIWKKSIIWYLILVLTATGFPAGALAQDGGDGDGGTGLNYPDSTSNGLPRQNVTGSAVTGRSPSTWILSATARYAQLHRRSVDEFGGADFNAEPTVPRRRIFLLAFLPDAFAILNDLILAYIIAIRGGEVPTTLPS